MFSACGLCVQGIVSGDCTKLRADQRRDHRRILYKPGTHTHTQLVRPTESLFYFLKYLYVQSVCLYLVEERQEVFDRTHLFQSFSELPGVAR